MTSENQAELGDHSALIERVRAEIAALPATHAQALLLHEAGVLHEAAGEEPLAARDFLASYNVDSEFREPLEALVRILSRRRSFKNLTKLLDAMARTAPTAEERARALRELAVVALEHDKNKDEARDRLEEAVAENPDELAAWLELEMLAAEAGDLAGVIRAIEARLPLVTNGTYKALLYIQLAELAAKAGQVARAYELLDAAAALEGLSRFQTRLVLERVAQSAADLEALAQALEGQAELASEALDDPERANEIGVPSFARTPAYVADALLRAAEIKRRLGDLEGASALLAHAARRLPDSSVVARARLGALEVSGDLEGSAAVARSELARGAKSANAAALWLRVAESAALASDRPAALDALAKALEEDPGAIPARAIELDLLIDGHNPPALAGALEGCAASFVTDGAKARAFLLAAYVWAVWARDPQGCEAALDRAVKHGVDPRVALRMARMFAVGVDDSTWFEATTEQLLAGGAEAFELPSLWFQLGRARMLRGDSKAAEDAFARLAETEGLGAFSKAPWLGRILGACAAGFAAPPADASAERPPRSPAPMDALAATESDPDLSRGLSLVAALRAAQSGDLEGARSRLSALFEAAPEDEVVAVFLAEVSSGAPAAAAAVLSRCASVCADSELSAALHLEASLYAWRANDRATAVAEAEAVRDLVPGAAGALLSWMRRGLDPSTLDGRRATASVGANDPYVAGLERFGLEVGWQNEGGDVSDALLALEAAEQAPLDGVYDDLVIGASLGRLLFPPANASRDHVDLALDRLESQGGDATIIARAERYRIARDVDQDPLNALKAVMAWADVEPTAHVALEYLASAIAAEDRAAEIRARELLAQLLPDDAGDAMRASATVVALLDRPADLQPLVASEHPAGRLMNLELATPGCDPRRRAAALLGLGEALGTEPYLDALVLGGFNDLVAGQAESALEAFKAVVDQRPDDLGAWEGVAAAADMLGQPVDVALACAQLGALCKDDQRGAQFWERAGLILLEHTDAHADAEIALERAFTRDPTIDRAFDKLFRRVRDRKDHTKLLNLIERRLEVAENETEIAKMFWERARVLQKRGDADGALTALENVTMLEPEHVGALALSGTICIQKGDFAGAAPLMAQLSQIKDAPKQERLVSGITACDLYENKLDQPEKALEVLVALHKEGLSTPPVRERLAKAAARTGAWTEATGILEQLMHERETVAGKIEAARLSLVIWRDKVQDPLSARNAVKQLLDEAPDDPEGLELVLQTNFDETFRSHVLSRGKVKLVEALQQDPCDVDRVALLARIAAAQGDLALRQATLGVLIALGRPDRGISDELAAIDAKVPSRPQVALDSRALVEIADPSDTGPVPRMFVMIAETVTDTLGPSLESLNVTKKNKIDPKGGPPLRLAVASWMGALGFDVDFDVYVGGPEPRGVQGVIVGEVPSVVVGSEITTPLDPAARSAVAREVFALRRGISSLRTRDDAAIASVVIAICNEVGLSLPNPGYAVYSEISRAVHKEISRKVKKAIPDTAREVAESGQDPKVWAQSARQSIDRMAAIAAGDVSTVLADILKLPRAQLSAAVRDSERAVSLMRFVLSPGYLELRRKLGMGAK